MRLRTLATMAFVLAGCGESFDPPSLVTDLRLLAVRAEPPEIAPGGATSARLGALVADPRHAAEPREVSVVYLSCTPSPGSLEANVCGLIETYADPARLPELLAAGALTCEPGAEAPGEEMGATLAFAGIEVCTHGDGCTPATVELGGVPVELPPPVYELPADFSFDGLPAGHRERTLGVQALTVAIAVAASPDELVKDADPTDLCAFSAKVAENLGELLDERDRVTAIKRVQVRGPDNQDPPNVNPSLPDILANGTPLADGTSLAREVEVRLRPGAPVDEEGKPLTGDALYQPFTRYDAEGKAFRGEREAWVWSWFTTAGSFERERTRALEKEQLFTTPGDEDHPVPADGRVFLYVVVRDARGGMDWQVREVRIE